MNLGLLIRGIVRSGFLSPLWSRRETSFYSEGHAPVRPLSLVFLSILFCPILIDPPGGVFERGSCHSDCTVPFRCTVVLV